MTIKSYFARTVEDAMGMARQELGADAMLLQSRRTLPEGRHLGEYEVVFAAGLPAASPAETSSPAPSERLAGEVAELKKQLEGMRRALTRSAFAPAQWLGAAPELAESYALLSAHEVAPDLAREIVQAAATRRSREGGLWPAAVAAEIESRCRVEAVLGVGERRPRAAALVGPPGAGKTTTLVKLAVSYGLACRRPVLLVSMDTYRIAAADQLRVFAAILGVGFVVLESPGALAQTLAENQGKELILIDTPGWGFADLDGGSDLAPFLAARDDIDTHLVLSCSMKSADLSRVIDGFEIFRPARLLFTRLDETAALGPILNETVRTGKPLSFFATGQRIPEDLEAATAGRLTDVILGGSLAQARSAA